MPTMMVSSAAMRRLRREGLDISRRRATLAPTGGVAVAKKPTPPPPYTFVLALPAPLPRRSLERVPPPRPPCAASSRPLHAAVEVTSRGMCIGKGAQVRVRTRVGVARSTGQPIVFWLRAVVDSAADEDGYLHVTYSYTSGKLPRVARVARSDVRLHDVPADTRSCPAASTAAGSSSAVTGNSSARPPQQSKAAPPPRPTVAGKKLLLLKKFEEMKSRSKALKAIIGCW